MRLRGLAIRSASGSAIGRPNASTPAVARLKPRRQDPRDAQRTFPRLPGPNPRASACGRALGTSGSLWRAACPSRRAAPRWDGDSAQASPARLFWLQRFAPRAAFKLTHRRIFGESAQASVRDSPRRDVAPQGRRQRRRRCLAKLQPARRRSGASDRFAPPRRRAAGLSPAPQALPGQTPARSAPHRCLRQCSTCGARERQRRRCGACRLRAAAAAGSRAAGAGLAAACGARGLEEPPPSAPGMRVAAARRGAATLDWLRVGRAAFIPGGCVRGAAAGGIRRRRLGLSWGESPEAVAGNWPAAAMRRPWLRAPWRGGRACLAATGRKPARRAGGRARGRRGGPAWSRVLKTGGGWGGCAPSSSRRHRRGEAACGTPPLGR